MFAYELAAILKDVACPHCRKEVKYKYTSPFDMVTAFDLSDECDASAKGSFFEELNTQLSAFNAQRITRPQLLLWMANYRNSGI